MLPELIAQADKVPKQVEEPSEARDEPKQLSLF